ncbi:MAG: DUF475 domain-containing protein [Candidatus Micrarchaeota archaeon]
MDFSSMLLTVIGLAFFEVVVAVDNAVVNAHILSTMSQKARRWFLVWGMLIAVFLVRGLLPWLIVFSLNPALGLWGSLTLSFSDDPSVAAMVAESEPVLLVAGGVFLLFLFFQWLFLQKKNRAVPWEAVFEGHGAWFYTVVSVLLTVVVWFALERHPLMAFGAAVGSTLFFITHGFKEYAEKKEADMVKSGGGGMSDWSKIFYLEVIDSAFSVDAVLGSFAFTLSVPLILVGNGIGALVVRQLTVHNITRITSMKFLKNGAMYSIAVLGSIMLADAFGAHIPNWLSPAATFSILGYFVWRSMKEVDAQKPVKSAI